MRSSALEKETIYYLLIDRFYNGDPTNDYAVNTSDPQDFHGEISGNYRKIKLH